VADNLLLPCLALSSLNCREKQEVRKSLPCSLDFGARFAALKSELFESLLGEKLDSNPLDCVNLRLTGYTMGMLLHQTMQKSLNASFRDRDG
jgi:hypothetical protein